VVEEQDEYSKWLVVEEELELHSLAVLQHRRDGTLLLSLVGLVVFVVDDAVDDGAADVGMMILHLLVPLDRLLLEDKKDVDEDADDETKDYCCCYWRY
jgi:hypothetical protein